MTVTKEKYVTIQYRFTTPDGTLLGTSDRQGPLTFCAGSGDIIAGLDSRLAGKEVGEPLSFVIPAEEAYGVRDEGLVKSIKFTEVSESLDVGMRLEAQFEGKWKIATVIDKKSDEYLIDGNHPLAGVPLHFDCSIVEISDEAPMAQGCGCGGGGCGCGSHGETEEGQSCSAEGCGDSCGCGGH